MKPTLLFVLVLIVLGVVAVAPANAASVPCAANPASGPVGNVITINCSGFVPNTYVTAWLTEPDGHAFSVPGKKTDGGGDVTFVVNTALQPTSVFAYGTWALTVQQGNCSTCGPIGKAEFTLTGGKEGVAGARLTASAESFRPGQSVQIFGEGFAPNEIVTVWFDFPNGDCSGATQHSDDSFFFNVPMGPGGVAFYTGRGTFVFGSFKTEADGDVSFAFAPPQYADFSSCQGEYHVVARGNSSKLGGDLWITYTGNAVTEGANLVANPSVVTAYRGSVTFYGSGYQPNEGITCWLTSPQEEVLSYYPFGASSNADPTGDFAFSITTGSNNLGNLGILLASEGALGDWAMSCRGNGSGRIGIARYSILGNLIDP